MGNTGLIKIENCEDCPFVELTGAMECMCPKIEKFVDADTGVDDDCPFLKDESGGENTTNNSAMPKLQPFGTYYLAAKKRIGVKVNSGAYMAMKVLYDIISAELSA